jgi:hypothetical protein
VRLPGGHHLHVAQHGARQLVRAHRVQQLALAGRGAAAEDADRLLGRLALALRARRQLDLVYRIA